MKTWLAAVGTIYFLAAPAGAAPLFGEIADPFGPEKCPPPGCWTNYLRVADVDGDGRLDVVAVNYADFFGGSARKQPLAIYLNDGAAHFTDASARIGDFAGELRQVAIGDVNGDGFPDIYAPNAAGGADAFFISDGHGGFADEAAARVYGRHSRAGAVRFVDVDGDGDLDVFVASGYAQGTIGTGIGEILLNDGRGSFAPEPGGIAGTMLGANIDDVDVLDANGDFAPDLLVNPHNGGNAALLINDGAGHFTVAPQAIPAAPGGGNHYDPGVCDFNGDGFPDLFIDNIASNYDELLLLNDGTGRFVDGTSHVHGNDVSEDDNGIICADVNNDGAFDAVVLSLGSTGERLLLNDGAGELTYVPGAFRQFADSTLWGEFGDLDGDGRIDLVTGQGESGSMADRVYLANTGVPVDDRPPTIRSQAQSDSSLGDGTAAWRFAVQDRDVSDDGPRLRRVFARTEAGGRAAEIAATPLGGDLFRVVVPEDAGAFAFCAVDWAGNEGCSPANRDARVAGH